jgi:biotin carboxyl carrier protein
VPDPSTEHSTERSTERSTARSPDLHAGARSAEARTADHAAIDRLADDLLPALVAKLGATGLGEIEVREGDWKVRLRRPAEGVNLGRRASDRASRAQRGHAGHGHAPGALEGHRPASAGAADPSTNGANRPDGGPDRRTADPNRDPRRDAHRAVATSPAVGIFQPRADLRPGARVRAGDRVGSVDMLGVPLEVVAPADGILGATFVESGQAVEYGQDLLVIELVGASPTAGSPAGGSAD